MDKNEKQLKDITKVLKDQNKILEKNVSDPIKDQEGVIKDTKTIVTETHDNITSSIPERESLDIKRANKFNDLAEDLQHKFSSFDAEQISNLTNFGAVVENATARVEKIQQDSFAGISESLTESFATSLNFVDRLSYRIHAQADQNIRNMNEAVSSFDMMQSNAGKFLETRMLELSNQLLTADHKQAVHIKNEMLALRKHSKKLHGHERDRMEAMHGAMADGMENLTDKTSIFKQALFDSLPTMDSLAERMLGGGIFGKFAGNVIRSVKTKKQQEAATNIAMESAMQKDFIEDGLSEAKGADVIMGGTGELSEEQEQEVVDEQVALLRELSRQGSSLSEESDKQTLLLEEINDSDSTDQTEQELLDINKQALLVSKEQLAVEQEEKIQNKQNGIDRKESLRERLRLSAKRHKQSLKAKRRAAGKDGAAGASGGGGMFSGLLSSGLGKMVMSMGGSLVGMLGAIVPLIIPILAGAAMIAALAAVVWAIVDLDSLKDTLGITDAQDEVYEEQTAIFEDISSTDVAGTDGSGVMKTKSGKTLYRNQTTGGIEAYSDEEYAKMEEKAYETGDDAFWELAPIRDTKQSGKSVEFEEGEDLENLRLGNLSLDEATEAINRSQIKDGNRKVYLGLLSKVISLDDTFRDQYENYITTGDLPGSVVGKGPAWSNWGVMWSANFQGIQDEVGHRFKGGMITEEQKDLLYGLSPFLEEGFTHSFDEPWMLYETYGELNLPDVTLESEPATFGEAPYINSENKDIQIAYSNALTEYHTGGLVRGNAPDIPAILAPGEFVVRAEAVKRLGLRTIESINNLSSVPLPLSKLAKFEKMKKKETIGYNINFNKDMYETATRKTATRIEELPGISATLLGLEEQNKQLKETIAYNKEYSEPQPNINQNITSVSNNNTTSVTPPNPHYNESALQNLRGNRMRSITI